MYSRILVSTDGSEVGQKGVEHGLSLARALKLEVIVITVTERYPVFSSGVGYDLSWDQSPMIDYAETQQKAADAILSSAKQSADGLGIRIETLHVPDAEVAEAIIDTAQKRECGLIVMASHGRRGLGRLLLGSKTSEVLTHSTIPVLVVR